MALLLAFNVGGACRHDGFPNVYGAVAAIYHDPYDEDRSCRTQRLVLRDGETAPTSLRADIIAMVLGLEWALQVHNKERPTMPIITTVRSDNGYVIRAMNSHMRHWVTTDWRLSSGQEIENRDMFEKALDFHDQIKARGVVHYELVGEDENVHAIEAVNQELNTMRSEGYGRLQPVAISRQTRPRTNGAGPR